MGGYEIRPYETKHPNQFQSLGPIGEGFIPSREGLSPPIGVLVFPGPYGRI